MEKKEDRRIAMTKRLLKAALIELLKEQDIYHISIRDRLRIIPCLYGG